MDDSWLMILMDEEEILESNSTIGSSTDPEFDNQISTSNSSGTNNKNGKTDSSISPTCTCSSSWKHRSMTEEQVLKQMPL